MRSFAFGPFVLVPERQLLLHGESPVRIGGRALDILTALVERPGQLVSKSELMARVWPNTFVDESNLKVNISALRRRLDDHGPNDARYIATVTGQGYRFVAPVSTAVSNDVASGHLEAFMPSDADAPTVAEICRRLVGLALAIAFAATRIEACASCLERGQTSGDDQEVRELLSGSYSGRR